MRTFLSQEKIITFFRKINMTLNEAQLEKIIFKSIVGDDTFFGIIAEKMKPEIFSKDCFKTVSSFYKEYHKRTGRTATFEEIKLYTSNKNFAAAVKESFESVENIDLKSLKRDEVIDMTENYIKKRLAILTFKQLVDDFDASKNVDADTLVQKFTEVASVKLVQNKGFDIYTDVEHYINESKDDTNRISTGFREIDENIGGGIPSKGKFIGVVAAPTNMGKSIFLSNLAVNVIKQNKRVLLITLEMAETVYAARIYSALYGIDISALPFRTEMLKNKINTEHPGQLIIKEFPPGTLTVAALDGYIDSLYKCGYEFDFVCVDYLTLMNAPGADNSNEAGKLLTRNLRALSYKYEIPFFTAAQINREGFNNEPDMRFMAESIAICAESDFIISLYRQEEDISFGIMRVAFLKSRLGKKGMSIQLRYNTEKLRFEDMTNSSALIEDNVQNDLMNALDVLQLA